MLLVHIIIVFFLFTLYRLAIFGFVFVLVGAFTFGIFLPLSTAISDICIVANESFFSDTPREDFFLDVMLSCAEDSPIMTISEYATTALDNTTSLICNVLTDACSSTYPCGTDASGSVRMCPLIVNCPNVSCNALTVDEWARMPVHDYYIGCFDYATKNFVINTTGGTCPYNPASTSIEVCDGVGPSTVEAGICNGDTTVSYPLDECAEKCSSQVLRDMAKEISHYYERYKKLAEVIEDEILPLFNCVTVKELLAELMNYMCYGTMASMKPITASVCVMAVLAMAATIVGIVSIKRFNKKYRMDETVENDEVELEGGEKEGGNDSGSDSDDAFGTAKAVEKEGMQE